MRAALVSSMALAPVALAQGLNITKTESVNLEKKSGQLGWGASGLAYDYSAGAGLNFSDTFVGGGFNAGKSGSSEGAFGGGWTLTDKTVEFGLGGIFNNKSFSIAINGDRAKGEFEIMVNGKAVAL